MTNFNRIPNRRKPLIWSKWTVYPPDVIPMWVADADFQSPPQILQALRKQIEHGVLGYEEPVRPFYEIIAKRMKKLYGWDVNPDWVVYTAGVNNGYNIAARTLCSKSRGYLIQTPVYNEFLDTKEKTHLPQRVAPLKKKLSGNRIKYGVDFDALEKEFKRSAMFLLCHPHNPTGIIYSSAELKRMAKICIENGTTIVSDEIHSEILLGGAKFSPLAAQSREIERHTITLTSASKAFNVPGLACAFAIIPDDEIRKRFTQITQGMSFEVSTPGLTGARVAYSGQADSWLKEMRLHLTKNRDLILNFVDEYLPGIRATQPDATYLMWLDFSELKLKPTPFEFFLKEAKVAFSDGGKFGKGNEQFVRLNFGTSRAILERGLERMKKALGN